MQSPYDQRIFLYTASTGTFKDLSALNIWNSEAPPIDFNMLVGDYIYIASFLPFNHKFFQFGTPDTTPRKPIIEVLNGPADWNQVVNQIDLTDGLKQSGVLGWVPDKDRGWALISRSKTEIPIFQPIATAPEIYDSYWMRISFDSPNAFTLKHVGQKFSSDADLYQEYPNLKAVSILNSWKVGKTTWDDQALTAASYISKALISKNIIFSNNQILDIAVYRSASVHKTANIIYSGLGIRNYAEEVKLTEQRFKDAMNQGYYHPDQNANGRRDRFEATLVTSGRASR